MLTRIKSAIGGLVEAQKSSSQAKDNLRAYRIALLEMLSDMRLDPHEVAQLRDRREGQGLDDLALGKIHREVLADLVRKIFEDGIVTEEEFEGVAQIGTALDVELSDLPADLSLAVNVAGSVIRIQQGHLPELPSDRASLSPSPGEVIHGETTAWLLDSKSTAVYLRRSTPSGTTIRQDVADSEIASADIGLFTVTSQRLVFAGQRHPFSTDWGGVHRMRPLRDGVLLTSAACGGTVLLRYLDYAAGDILMALLTHYLHHRP